MNINQAAQQYLSESPGFSAETGVPARAQTDAAMKKLVALADQAEPADNRYRHLDQIVAAVAELAPKSAVIFDQQIVTNPEQKKLAKALEIAMAAMESRSPETWNHILHHTALTMLYYERETGLANSANPANTAELLTLMVGAIGHDVGKLGLDPKLLHKFTRVEPERFDAALAQFKASVPDYPEKLHDMIFLEEANQGKIIFADKSASAALGKDPLILDIGKDLRRSEEYWVKDEERQRHNAIWERINAKATQTIKDNWLSVGEQKALTLAQRGTVTPEEIRVIATHDDMSEAFFAAAPLPKDLMGVRDIVSMDRFRDGKNKPTAPGISPLADIIHATDVYEALTANRSYRKAYTVEEADRVIEGMVKKGKVSGDIVARMENNGTIDQYAEAVGLQHSADLAKPEKPREKPTWLARLFSGKKPDKPPSFVERGNLRSAAGWSPAVA